VADLLARHPLYPELDLALDPGPGPAADGGTATEHVSSNSPVSVDPSRSG
jgi:hypothetical protein